MESFWGMRVRLKGINSKRVTRASSRKVSYYDAWKVARVSQESREVSSFSPPGATRRYRILSPRRKTLTQLFRADVDRQAFRTKAAQTRTDYLRLIEKIDKEFGDFPIGAIADPRTRDEFLTWRDGLAKLSVRQAEYTLAVLSIIFPWAKNRRKIPVKSMQ